MLSFKSRKRSMVFPYSSYACANKHVPEEENISLPAANFNTSNGEITSNDSTWAGTQGSLFRHSSPKIFSPSIFNHMLPQVAYNRAWP